MIDQIIEFIRDTYKTNDFIPLHAPVFSGNELQYVSKTIKSTFVSSVGHYVENFERELETYTGSKKVVATVNGTAALHTALYLAGVRPRDLVITQALTFVATCNVLHHLGARPLFIDVSKVSLGLSPQAVDEYLEEEGVIDNSGECYHKKTGQKIKAVVPMHTFGHPVELDELVAVCEKWNLILVEDSAESLGSFYKKRHTGTYGAYGALSFNGNKVITTGGGGAILCPSDDAGFRAKHITTTAKIAHPYEYDHDEAGFNYRMPNLNAALGCAQMENLSKFVSKKRNLASKYKEYFNKTLLEFVEEPNYAESNYWLNAVICPDADIRNQILEKTNANGVMTRPVWKLMNRLPMYDGDLRGDLVNSEWLQDRLLNLPSSPV
ncbi:MAG: aminotransferase in exopolysaccharide biosynthesis [Desulforhopalus sp.]|jgi:aminotransferase in exopolysaccharide biosynthesis